jgi:citrate synthase
MVGSSGANLFASISAGISALSGPLHGGANQKVIEMLEKIRNDGGNYGKYVELAKDRDSDFRLMGFGHRVYKNFDPRAKILKRAADKVLDELGTSDQLLEIAKQLEEVALTDEFFIERKLYPNVDFYSGIIYRAMGIPTEMFTVMFALGRLPGWIAQWREMRKDPKTKINRPRQIYVGATERDYVPIDERKPLEERTPEVVAAGCPARPPGRPARRPAAHSRGGATSARRAAATSRGSSRGSPRPCRGPSARGRGATAGSGRRAS